MSGKLASWNEARSRLGDMEEIWRRYGGDMGERGRRYGGAREWDLEREITSNNDKFSDIMSKERITNNNNDKFADTMLQRIQQSQSIRMKNTNDILNIDVHFERTWS